MTLTFNVCDVSTGLPLSGATVTVDQGQVGQTDSNGNIMVDITANSQIGISYVGYSSYTIFGGLLEESAQVQLSRINSLLPAVVINPNQSTSGSGLWPWAIGGGLLLALASSKGKVGASKKTNTLLIIGAAGLGAYLLMNKSGASLFSPAGPQTLPTGRNYTSPGAPPLQTNVPSLVNSGTGLLKAFSNLFSGGSPPAPANNYANPGGPGAFTPISVTDLPPAYVDPGSAYSPPPSSGMDLTFPPAQSGLDLTQTVPPADISAPVNYATQDFSAPMAGISFSDSGFLLPAAAIIGGMLLFSKKKRA